jgi:hypothetical protein
VRDPEAQPVAAEAYQRYRAGRLDGQPPPARLITAFRDLVLTLPAYGPERWWTAAGAPEEAPAS